MKALLATPVDTFPVYLAEVSADRMITRMALLSNDAHLLHQSTLAVVTLTLF